MNIPSATDIRAWSDVEFDELGYSAPSGDDPDRLDVLIVRTVPELESLLADAGHVLDLAAVIDDRNNSAYDKRVPLIEETIQHMVEYRAASGQMELLETASDYDMLQSFSAGGYSESRRNALRGALGHNQLHPWPLVNRLLHILLYFDSGGRARPDTPVVGVVTPDWDLARDIIDAHRGRQLVYTSYPDIYRPPWVGGAFPP